MANAGFSAWAGLDIQYGLHQIGMIDARQASQDHWQNEVLLAVLQLLLRLCASCLTVTYSSWLCKVLCKHS